MKLIVAGGRDYRLTADDLSLLDDMHTLTMVTELVSGDCSGADWESQLWAGKNKIPVKLFPAQWQNGRAAGPARNREMAAYADAVVLFPGGKGTESMYQEAVRAGLHIYDYRNNKP